ncbi:MAG: Ig-like domain-containing protein, partial [Neisseria sp.]|uniref:Ig-like domain-containing protein n=1 Tax=Neisseria sp. TaxID=192066 RepID=UPI0026DBCCAD
SVRVQTADDAGNSAEGSATLAYAVDTEIAEPVITLEPLTADNIINAAESQTALTVSGKVANARDGDPITLTVGDQSYTAAVQNGSFSISVEGSVLAAHNEISVRVQTADDAGNSAEGSATLAYAVDTEIAEPVIQIHSIAEDDIINLVESQTETTMLSGTVDNARENDEIVLTIGEAVYRGTVNGGVFNVAVDTKTLLNHGKVAASLTTVDDVQNSATGHAERSYRVDTEYAPTISLNKIAGDNILNISESEGTVTVTGKVTDVADGEDVLVSCGCESCGTVNWIDIWAKVQNGGFTVDFSGTEIKADGYNIIKASVTSSDEAGNTATVETSQSYTKDLQAPEVGVSIDVIAGDDILTQAERAQSSHRISGTITGMQEGEQISSVSLEINGQNYEPLINGDSYSAEIPTDQLAAADHVTVYATVIDAAGNRTVAENSRSYHPSVPKPVITLDPVAGDDYINKAEADGNAITLSGSVENVADGTEIKLVAVSQSVTALVTGGRFSTDVAKTFFGIANNTNQLNGTLTASVNTPNDAGVNETTSASRPYRVDLVNATAITIDSITGDNVLDENEIAQSSVTISGKVTDGKPGETVTVTVNKIVYTTTVQADGTYRVEAEPARFAPTAAEGKYAVLASVARVDAAGNTGSSATVSTSRMLLVDKTPPTGTIVFDSITGDNIINQNEAAQATVTVSGKVTGLKDGDDVQSVTLVIAGQEYPAKLLGTTFNAAIPSDVITANTVISAKGEVKDSTGRIAEAVGATQNYSLQTTPPTVEINIDSINGGKALNAAGLSEKVMIEGSLVLGATAVANSATVTVTINGTDYAPTLSGTRWQLEVPATVLATGEGDLNLAASVTVADTHGNIGSNQTSGNYRVDTVAPAPVIVLDPIAVDDIIDSSENNGDIVLSGTVSGEFKEGDKVILTVNSSSFEADVGSGGIFSANVSAALLVAAQIPAVKAAITTTDDAGNTGSAQTSRGYSVKNGDIDIRLNLITGDDLINVTEAKQEITISGSVSGTDAQPGQTVQLSVNGEVFNVTVQDDYRFSQTLSAGKLLADGDYTVQASIQTGNGSSAKTSRSYEVAAEAAARIDITGISSNFDASLPQAVSNTRISGVIELNEGVFTEGMNDEVLRQITVTIGEKSYRAGVKADRSFYLDIPTEELATLNGQTLSFKVNADPLLYDLVQTDTNSYRINTLARNTTVPVKSVTFDSPFIEQNQDGQYVVSNAEAVKTDISGIVSGSAKAGDTVTLDVGGKIYTTQVSDDLTFSAAVLAEDLTSAQTVRAVLNTHDLSGASISVADTENYAAPNQNGGTFVSAHSKMSGTVNSDHSAANYNFPYFIQKTGSLNGGSYGIPFGGKTDGPAIIKYHFLTLDEINALPANYNNSIDRSTMTTYSSDLQTIIRNAYKEISAVTNIEFVEVGSMAEANTNYIMGNLINGFEGSSAIAYNGGLIAWNSRHNYMSWGKEFVHYTVLHEVTHTLGMAHTSGGFTGDYKKEETIEFSNMSYNAYVNNALFLTQGHLRTYDLAYLHYAFGINQNVRTGNDTYTFKNYNMYSQDADRYIWDAGGVDTFDVSDEKQGVTVNLTPGSWIYTGGNLEKTFAVASSAVYDMRSYFGLDSSATLTGNSSATVTLNTYTEGQAFIGYGTQIENLIGSEHADVLTGNNADNNIYGGAGNDTISGGAGNDHLDGGSGADTLAGGTGNDTYVVDDEQDTVIEAADQGDADHVYSSVTHTLSANLEQLTLIGNTAVNGQGNGSDNTLHGNGADNILEGLGGNDRIIGGTGNDTLTGGEGRDVFVFDSILDGSIDTITDFVYGDDTIELSAAIFGNISNNMNGFADYISFQNSTGYLYYDSDGKGQTDGIHFATLLNKDLTLDSSNFNIV